MDGELHATGPEYNYGYSEPAEAGVLIQEACTRILGKIDLSIYDIIWIS